MTRKDTKASTDASEGPVRTPVLPPCLQPEAGPTVPAHTGPRCPFYGMTGWGFPGAGFMLRESHGNACGFTCEHRPCRMEVERAYPEWKTCVHVNRPENRVRLDAIMEDGIVFADAFAPRSGTEWAGVPFYIWKAHVMGEEGPL